MIFLRCITPKLNFITPRCNLFFNTNLYVLGFPRSEIKKELERKFTLEFTQSYTSHPLRFVKRDIIQLDNFLTRIIPA